MPFHLRSRGGDLLIRLAGLIVMPLGAASIYSLYHLVHAGPQHSATLVEAGLAAAGFICLSFGSMLVVLGAHLLDEVEISPRWAPRSQVRPWIGSDGLLGRAMPIRAPEAVAARSAVRMHEGVEA